MPPSHQAIESALRLHVDRLAGLIGPRIYDIPMSIEAAMGYIRGQWASMQHEIVEEPFDALGLTAKNLIVERQGSSKASEIILLGAHYDTVPSTPGADDNASAVAVLLEVSRLLKDHTGKRTARYVAFACEEPPYFNFDSMGSQHHARQARKRGENIIGMLCLEMVGYFSDEPGSQQIPRTIPKAVRWLFPKRGNFLAAVGNLASWKLAYRFRFGFKRGTRLRLFSICLPEKVGEIRLSDNSSFWDQGYPALMLTDTSFLRNPHYHQPTDTPDTLDYARMTEVTLGVAAAMKRLLG
jgi:Zn-dependent M28 family amino/carboxypeptidase